MVETDSTLSIVTALLVISTVAVAIATFSVWRATNRVAETTKEIGKLTIMPRISIIGHNKIGSDENHDHYEFSLKNEGVGNAFDIQIEILHKGRSVVPPLINTIGINAADRVIDKSVDKDENVIKYKLTYLDHADNKYQKELSYRINTGIDKGTYASNLDIP